MDSELLKARIEDTAEICRRTNKPKFLGFLSLEEKAYAENILKYSDVDCRFFGGFEEANRVMLGCFPDWIDDYSFPLTSVTFSYKKEYTLTHRDFLGSLMALGIKREAVGDILVGEGKAVAFVTTEIKDFILSQISKIGRVGVSLSEGCEMPLPQAGRLEAFTDTISSNRLDCIVSSVVSVSRARAQELIENGFVSVNSVVYQKSTKEVLEKDVLTVRGKGKFIISSLSHKTKKQRTVLEYKKYV